MQFIRFIYVLGCIGCCLQLAACNKRDRLSEKVSVPVGKLRRIGLADSSEVMLNSLSEIIYPKQFGSERFARQTCGEGRYNILPDDREFVLHANPITISTKSAMFNVNMYASDGEIIVSVLAGEALVRCGEKNNKLTSGLQLNILGAERFIVGPCNKDSVESWVQGVQTFDAATIAEMIPLINRWYGENVILDEPAAGSYPIRMSFRLDVELKAYLDLINMMGGVEFYYLAGHLHCRTPRKR